MVAVAKTLWTVEEYLAVDEASEFKHEFVHGRVYAMTGASPAHHRIAFNVGGALAGQLGTGPCAGYSGDMRLRVPGGNYLYPDLTVVCGEPEYERDRGHSLLNPTLVVEVLSPSTERYDRTEKGALYRSVASLQEYLLISQTRPQVEHYARQADGSWRLLDYVNPDARVELRSIGCTLLLADIYANVHFEDEEGGARQD